MHVHQSFIVASLPSRRLVPPLILRLPGYGLHIGDAKPENLEVLIRGINGRFISMEFLTESTGMYLMEEVEN